MPTTISFTNESGEALTLITNVSPGLSPDDWGVDATSFPVSDSAADVLWFNRNEGITRGDTWVFTTEFTVDGVSVSLQEKVTGTFANSTMYQAMTAGDQQTGFVDANGVASLRFTGDSGKQYTLSWDVGGLPNADIVYTLEQTDEPDWVPTTSFAEAVVAAGFTYDPTDDILISQMDPPQRAFGYAWAYDASSVFLGMVIDCEPFFFEYDDKYWMIELWKGQYGLETGAEIGVYNRPIDPSPLLKLKYDALDPIIGARPDDDPNGRYYPSAEDADRLVLSFTLERDGEPLFTRAPTLHWWLTGFRWGVFSQPSDLVMNATIQFPNQDMLAAFEAALVARGYTPTVTDLTVAFTFDTPTTVQPTTIYSSFAAQAQVANQAIVSLYNDQDFPNNDPNSVPEDSVVVEQIESFFAGIGSLDGLEGALEDIGIDVAKIIKYLTGS